MDIWTCLHTGRGPARAIRGQRAQVTLIPTTRTARTICSILAVIPGMGARAAMRRHTNGAPHQFRDFVTTMTVVRGDSLTTLVPREVIRVGASSSAC